MKYFFVILVLCFANLAWAERLISVNGLASKMIEPNLAKIDLDVWAKGSDAKTAQNFLAKQAEKLRATLNENRIKAEDIQTQYLNVSPEYVWEKNKQKLTGYRASQRFAVILHDLKKTGVILQAAVTSSKENDVGVSLGSLVLDSDRKAEVMSAVLESAVSDAKAKAEVIAKAASVKIKWLHKVQYSQPAVEYPREQAMQMSSKMLGSEASLASTIEVDPGLIKVSVELTADYEIQ